LERNRRMIGAVEGVVHYWTGPAVPLRNYPCRGEAKMREVTNGIIWQDGPVSHFDVFPHVFCEEFGILGGHGNMGAPEISFIALKHGPRWRVKELRGPSGSYACQVFRCGVQDVTNVCGYRVWLLLMSRKWSNLAAPFPMQQTKLTYLSLRGRST